MNIEPTSLCVCQHIAAVHRLNGVTGEPHCTSTIEIHHNGTYYTFCECKTFKLDNLKYLEQRAEEKENV